MLELIYMFNKKTKLGANLMKKLTKLAVTTAALAMTASAMAAGTTSTASVKTSKSSKILEKLSLSYGLDYTGSLASDPTSVQTSNQKGETEVENAETGLDENVGRTNYLHTGKISYKISKDLKAWAQGRYSSYTGGNEGGDNLIVARDPRIGANLANAYKIGNVPMTAFMYTEEGVSAGSAAAGQARRVALGTYGSMNLNNKTSVGVYTFVRPRFYRNAKQQQGASEYNVYLEPSVSYSVNDTVSLSAAHEIYMSNRPGKGMNDITADDDGKVLVLGLGLNLAKNLSLTPQIDLFQDDDYNLDSARIGASASYTIF